jgi:hypothetical protein
MFLPCLGISCFLRTFRFIWIFSLWLSSRIAKFMNFLEDSSSLVIKQTRHSFVRLSVQRVNMKKDDSPAIIIDISTSIAKLLRLNIGDLNLIILFFNIIFFLSFLLLSLIIDQFSTKLTFYTNFYKYLIECFYYI